MAQRLIVIIGPAHPYRGGLAAFNERLAQELQQRGWEVRLITFTLQYPDWLFPGKTQYTDDPAPTHLHIERRINALNPFNWWKVGRALRRARPAAVVAAFWLPLLAPCLGSILRIARSAGVRTLGLVHNIIPHEKRPGDRLLARYFARSADGFVVMSKSVGEELAGFARAGSPIRYAPHPVYDHYGQPAERADACRQLGLDATRRYLLFFGFIRDYKGLDLLLRALAEPSLRAQPDLYLLVAGEFYGNEEKYQTLIDQLAIRERLILHTHFIPHDAVRNYFAAADLVIQPYRTATQSGISQLAYHFGTPMVVTRVGGLPEIVPHGEAGYVVDPDPAAIAAAVADFYDQQRAPLLRAGVAARRQLFSWAALAGQVEEVVGLG